MRYHIERDCHIHFATPVREHHVQIRFAPWDDISQSLTQADIRIDPESPLLAVRDGFGNLSHHCALLEAHTETRIRACFEVETHRANPFDFQAIPIAREQAWIADSLHQAPRIWDFVLHRSPLTPALPAAIGERPIPVFDPARSLIAQAQEASAWVAEVIPFDPEQDTPVASLRALLDAGQGCATDLAHLLVAIMRQWRVPARFVSGYVDAAYFDPDETDPPDTPPRVQTLHHWTEILIPGGGWLGFDPAFGLLADATYVRVAVGRDSGDLTPLRQTYRGASTPPTITEALTVTTTLAESSASGHERHPG